MEADILKLRATEAFLWGILLTVLPAAAGAQEGGSQPGPLAADSRTLAVIDPSMRSTLAVPAVQLAAEIADDKKQATAKLGFPVRGGWTAEVGFTGAFDHDVAASHPTSLRRLTDGSSLWGATTWTRSPASPIGAAGSTPATRRVTPLVSARIEASRSEFNFYDMTLARQTDRHTAYAATATAGLLLPKGALVAVSYRWSEVWQIAGQVESCRIVAETGATSCPADWLFRPPTPQSRQQLEAQVQAHLGDKVGAEVFLTRDFRDRAWGIEAPLYFMARPDGGFTSGVVLTYNGHLDRFDVSAFVGQVFHPFK